MKLFGWLRRAAGRDRALAEEIQTHLDMATRDAAMREFGVRMALGASTRQIQRSVIADAFSLTLPAS